jgi:ornithine lipid ester-linked acyl 2-hydroxylase
MNTVRYKISAYIGKSIISFLEFLVKKWTTDEIYFDSGAFSWTKNFEKNYTVILNEYTSFYRHHIQKIPDICEVSEEQNQVVDKGVWKFIPLFAYGIEHAQFTPYFPKTVELLHTIPNFTTAFFSILQPNMDIAQHRGAYKGYLRFQLGIQIPKDSKNCGISIAGIEYHWQNGQSVIFDDTFQHHAWNHTNEIRTVLYVDFIRPMPWWLTAISKWLTAMISRSLFIQNAIRNLERLEKTPLSSTNNPIPKP